MSNTAGCIHRFAMTEAAAERVFAMTKSHIAALHNWTASAVERGETARAQELVRELREHEKLYAAFNMEAKHDIARLTDKALVTQHDVAI